MKILLIEDKPELAALIKPLLEKKFNAVVTELNSIQTAIEVMESNWDKPDVVICDYHGTSVSLMKFMLGFCQKVPCIFITDHSFPIEDLYKVPNVVLMLPVQRTFLTKELIERLEDIVSHPPDAETQHRIQELNRIITAAKPDASPEELREATENSLEVIKDLTGKLGFTPQIQHLAMKSVELSLKVIGKSPRLSSIAAYLNKNEAKYITSHSLMLAEIACALACKVGWNSASTFLKLTLAAYLHDMPIKENSTAKFQSMREAEAHLENKDDVHKFRMHPVAAAELARRFHEIPPDVDTIVSQHHERPDGSGFPRGLVHKQIAPLAALFIVAEDVLHYFLENDGTKTMEDYVRTHGEQFTAGGFLKILKAMTENKAA